MSSPRADRGATIATGIDMTGFMQSTKRKLRMEAPLPPAAPSPETIIALMHEKARRQKEAEKSAENAEFEKVFDVLRIGMDSKMQTIEDFVEFVDENSPQAQNTLEHVIGEVERENVELQNALEESEKQRVEMENAIKENNKEITELRSQTFPLDNLDEEVCRLTEKCRQDHDIICQLHSDVEQSKQQEYSYHNHLEELETIKEQIEKEHREQVMSLSAKMRNEDNTLEEKQLEIEAQEQTLKEMMHKCEQLTQSNADFRSELESSLDSGRRSIDGNAKLHFCKQYLEQQIDQLVKAMQAGVQSCSQLKQQLSGLQSDKVSAEKEIKLLRQRKLHTDTEIKTAKENTSNLTKQLKDFEVGKLRSSKVITEINDLKDDQGDQRKTFQKKVRMAEDHIKELTDETKMTNLTVKRQKGSCVEMQCKLDFFHEAFIDKSELHHQKAELERRFKLDVEEQVDEIVETFDQERIDLSKTIRESLRYKRVAEDDFDTKVHNIQEFRRRTMSQVQPMVPDYLRKGSLSPQHAYGHADLQQQKQQAADQSHYDRMLDSIQGAEETSAQKAWTRRQSMSPGLTSLK